jgi:hypothetical protein
MIPLSILVIAIIFSILFIIPIASAHLPRIVTNNAITVISDPGISQAFYGNLTGQPAVYTLNSDSTPELYIQILLPDLPNPDFRTLAVLTQNNTIISVLDGSTYNWTSWHEDFANDDYWQGPNITITASGNYTITVTNTNNLGKYVLVIGNKESFPPVEMIKALMIMPQLKEFMGKSSMQAYNNRIGLYYYTMILIIALIISIAIIPRKRKKKESHKQG